MYYIYIYIYIFDSFLINLKLMSLNLTYRDTIFLIQVAIEK